jgi:hypothetical protein
MQKTIIGTGRPSCPLALVEGVLLALLYGRSTRRLSCLLCPPIVLLLTVFCVLSLGYWPALGWLVRLLPAFFLRIRPNNNHNSSLLPARRAPLVAKHHAHARLFCIFTYLHHTNGFFVERCCIHNDNGPVATILNRCIDAAHLSLSSLLAGSSLHTHAHSATPISATRTWCISQMSKIYGRHLSVRAINSAITGRLLNDRDLPVISTE